MTSTVISYPIPLYQNLPIAPQYYQPSQFEISAIDLGRTTIVTLENGTNDVSPNFVIGQQIRFLIPSKYGTRQLNEKTGLVISLPSSIQVEVNIDSSQMDPFIASPTFLPFQQRTPAQIVAIGDVNTGALNNSGNLNNLTYISGSFLNISPI